MIFKHMYMKKCLEQKSLPGIKHRTLQLMFARIKYPYNQYLQTIITIRIELGWVKRKEGCEMPD